MNDKLQIRAHYVVVLRGEGGELKGRWTIPNVVTTAGKAYVAKRIAGSANAPIANTAADPDYSSASGRLLLCHKLTGTVTPAAGDDYGDTASYDGVVGLAGWDAGYPKVNDADADNTGAGTEVTSYRVSYTAAAFNQTDLHGLMVVHSGSSGTNPILSHAVFGAKFDKSASDTLKVFYNITVA